MSQSVKFSDGSYLDATDVWDTTQGKTQQAVNNEIISGLIKRKVITFSGKAITTKSAKGNYYGKLGTISDYGLTESQIISVFVGDWNSCEGCITPYVLNGSFNAMSNVSCASIYIQLIVGYI